MAYFSSSMPCSGSFACLIKPSWPYQIAVVPLSKLQWHGANNFLPSCAGVSAHLSIQLRKNQNAGTATMVEKDPEQIRCSAKM